MSEIKFTEDELKGLQEIQQQYQSVQMQLGGLKMQQIAHEKNAERLIETEDALMSGLDELTAKEQELAKELNDKYGPGSLNPETGVFTPAPAQEASEASEVEPADG
tara:strand:+ start:313 stop:630 length:318 start_codon:yes stop_codon:yes gene_type:complete